MATQGRGEQLNPEILQQVLEAGSNGSQKGQSQFMTPVEFARILSIPLPRVRKIVIDLNCGAGNLLAAAINPQDPKQTEHLLGLDIDDCRDFKAPVVHDSAGKKIKVPWIDRITGNLCEVAPLLVEGKFFGDLFALNPPFGLHWWRKYIDFLSESATYSIEHAYRGYDSVAGKEKIDSWMATYLLSLEFMTFKGEGYAIGNANTIERLMFNDGAPHKSAAAHVWAYVTIDGNPMTGRDDANFRHEEQFRTGIVYYAKGHTYGVQKQIHVKDLAELERELSALSRLQHRHGPSITSEYHFNTETVDAWRAVSQEWLVRSGKRKSHYNIYLGTDGKIHTDLSSFEHRSSKVDKNEVGRLFKLNDQTPMQLVLQASQRNELKRAIESGIWKVDPELPKMVEKAILEYHAVRAPIMALSPIQRMGYLDEENSIECKRDMSHAGQVIFKMGKRYELSTKTVLVERKAEKLMNDGEKHEVLLNGQELLIEIKGEDDTNYPFMDARHLVEGVKIEGMNRWDSYAPYVPYGEKPKPPPPKFKLQDLEKHFVIPNVPDVAECNPERYRANMLAIERIEERVNKLRKLRGMTGEFKCKHFQREDLSRGALHDGFICAWATGLGKTVATYIWPLIQVGIDESREGAYPAAPCLIVAPENLHDQIIAEAQKLLCIDEITKVYTQEDYMMLAPLKPGWYITSYTQLTQNGVKRIIDPSEFGEETDRWFDAVAAGMVEFGITEEMVEKATGFNIALPFHKKAAELVLKKVKEYSEGVGEEVNGIRCVYSPSMAELSKDSYACLSIDEAVRIKGADTIVGTGVRMMSPKFRLVLSATPIKNRLPDIFYLAWWACGGHDQPTARFPYGPGDQEKFAQEFMVSERDLTKERKENGGQVHSKWGRGGKLRRGKVTPEVCNIHRLWKLLGPNVLRRRKQECGEDIVQKIRKPIYVPMGTKQQQVYKYHLEASYVDEEGNPCIGAQLQALRSVAAAPHSPLLRNVDKKDPDVSPFRSDCDYIPKVAAALTLIEQILRRGEQVAVFSALLEPLDTLSRKLKEAGIPHEILDGRKNQKVRGNLSKRFTDGEFPVTLNGVNSMAEGNNWWTVNNAIIIAFDWAYDKFEQAINRVHRMSSPKDVNVYPIICEGTIDRKLEALIDEKANACELVLDGQLMGENVAEVSMHELLKIAKAEFDGDKKTTLDEDRIESEWPALRAKLREAYETVPSQNPKRAEQKTETASSAPESTPIFRSTKFQLTPEQIEAALERELELV